MTSSSTIELKRAGLYLSIYLIFVHLAVLLWGRNTGAYLFLFALVTPAVVYHAVEALRAKDFLFLFFLALLYELMLVMTVRLLMLRVPENSWRLQYNLDELNMRSFQCLLLSLTILLFFYGFRVCKTQVPWNPYDFHIAAPVKCLFALGALGYAVLYVLRNNIFQRRVYTAQLDSTWMSLFRICMVLALLFLYSERERRSLFTKTLLGGVSLVYVLISGILAINGYRYLAVEVGILIFLLFYKRLRRTHVILLGAVMLAAYGGLTLLKVVYQGTNVAASLFAHERNIFYSLNAIIQNRPPDGGSTYLATLLNLLPRALTGSTGMNTGETIMQYIASDMHQTTGLTMGAFYLTEAYFNLGFGGIYLVSAVFSALILALEKMKDTKAGFAHIVYCQITTQVCSIVYYGSSNYLKIILYFCAAALLLMALDRLVCDVLLARRRTESPG